MLKLMDGFGLFIISITVFLLIWKRDHGHGHARNRGLSFARFTFFYENLPRVGRPVMALLNIRNIHWLKFAGFIDRLRFLDG